MIEDQYHCKNGFNHRKTQFAKSFLDQHRKKNGSVLSSLESMRGEETDRGVTTATSHAYGGATGGYAAITAGTTSPGIAYETTKASPSCQTR